MKKQTILIIILLLIIVGILSANNYFGGFLFGKSLDTNFDRKDYTHLEYNSSNEENNMKVSIIYTFNEDNICISSRMKYEFSDTNLANEQYENWKKVEDIKNLEIENNIVCFNGTYNIGKTKEELINLYKEESEIIEVY